MRILGGHTHGRKFSRSPGSASRPPLARLRQSIFSILEARGRLAGSRVLDLFAGSGSFGLESASRGAREVVFVELDERAATDLEHSIRELGFPLQCRVTRADALAPLDLYSLARPSAVPERAPGNRSREVAFDLIFVDPPFRLFRGADAGSRLARRVLEILDGPILDPGGLLVLRYPRELAGGLPLSPSDTRLYGQSAVSFFEKPPAAGPAEESP